MFDVSQGFTSEILLFTIEQAVHAMTGRPAARFGFRWRCTGRERATFVRHPHTHTTSSDGGGGSRGRLPSTDWRKRRRRRRPARTAWNQKVADSPAKSERGAPYW
jgi:hypothetical protein